MLVELKLIMIERLLLTSTQVLFYPLYKTASIGSIFFKIKPMSLAYLLELEKSSGFLGFFMNQKFEIANRWRKMRNSGKKNHN